VSSRYDQAQVRDVGLMTVLASTRPADLGERLIIGAAIVLICGLFIVLGAALASNQSQNFFTISNFSGGSSVILTFT
jgi:hypothetical protein